MWNGARNSSDKASREFFVANNMHLIVTRIANRINDLESYYSLHEQDVG